MTSQREKNCPVCGSTNIEEHKAKDQIAMPFAGVITFDIIENRCNECGEEGDFFGQNKESTARAIEELNKKSAMEAMEHLTATGRQMAYMERALRLPQRTMMRWKQGEVTAAVVALLRFLRIFPGLIEVADDKFSAEAKERFVKSEVENFVTMNVTINFLNSSERISSSPVQIFEEATYFESYFGNRPSTPHLVASTSEGNLSSIKAFVQKIGCVG